MGLVKIALILSLSFGIGYFGHQAHNLLSNDYLPEVRNELWGPGSQPGNFGVTEDEVIYPFSVNFTSPPVLSDLKTRLRLEQNRTVAPLEGVGFGYGFNTKYLNSVTSYWLESYNFKAREKYLNRWPHFKTTIGGLVIHFQHVKAQTRPGRTPVAIIFLHGWPTTFVIYQKLIVHFLEDEKFNFEIVVPSLPGYGFSEAPSRPGMSTPRIAKIFGRLMKRLGYQQYYVLGEDFGGIIATDMGILYPDRVKGVHTSCLSLHPMDHLKQHLVSLFSPATVWPHPRPRSRFSSASKMLSHKLKESGYLHLQATKPDTLGVSLSQSPSGLAAYILEKFSSWTNEEKVWNEDGGLASKFQMDSLLDNVNIYWVSNSITTSMRLYLETFNGLGLHLNKVPMTTPASCIATPDDIFTMGEVGLSTKYPNLKEYTAAEEGGHFVALEIPQLVAKQALEFIYKIEFGGYSAKIERLEV